jgi:hypothetical protein
MMGAHLTSCQFRTRLGGHGSPIQTCAPRDALFDSRISSPHPVRTTALFFSLHSKRVQQQGFPQSLCTLCCISDTVSTKVAIKAEQEEIWLLLPADDLTHHHVTPVFALQMV